MELSQLTKHGLQKLGDFAKRIMTSENSDTLYLRFAALRTQYHIAMRPFLRLCVQLIVRLADGPARNVLLLGLRLWLGAFLLRKGVTALFLLYKLVRRQMTAVLSIGSGSSKSVARRDAWRLTVPVREVGLAPLHTVQFLCYATEQVGGCLIAGSLLLNAVTTRETGVVYYAQRTVMSILTLRPIRLPLANPIEFLIVYPLIYAWMRYRSVSSVSKAKVTVTQTVNNFYGGRTETKVKHFDPLLLAHLGLHATGLPWLAQMFIVYRNSFFENGPAATFCAFKDNLTGWFKSSRFLVWLGLSFLDLVTRPLYVCAVLLAGTHRPSIGVRVAVPPGFSAPPVPPRYTPVPAAVAEHPAHTLPVTESVEAIERPPADRPGIGFSEPAKVSNALVEIFCFPHGVGLELFKQGESLLIGGESLPVISVVTDPRLRVIIPMKPVTNNTFAWDMLSVMGDHPVAIRLRELTKVAPNPFRAAVEVQKFVSLGLDINFDDVGRFHPTLTLRDFFMAGLRQAYDVLSTERIVVPDLTLDAEIDKYLSSETKKHHPGWTTRAFGGQTKGEAWPYSLGRAVKLWPFVLNGEDHVLRAHVWLSLPVVKKQAERKPDDALYRCRGAVIPEQELQILWTHLLRPLVEFLETKHRSWAPKFELFHRGLERVWRKFYQLRDVTFSEEDMSDHGASLPWEVAEVIADFYGSLVFVNGGHSRAAFRVLFREMIFACLAVPGEDGSVKIVKTSRGMKDGVWGTSFIGGTYKIVGELYKLWVAWNNNRAIRDAFPDLFGTIAICVEEVHGDNAVAAYPIPAAPFMAGTYPDVAKVVSRIGLVVKPSESVVSSSVAEITCMSWRMANIGTLARPHIVGWKDTASVLKSFFLPERIADFDHISDATRDYLGQILVCMYILGYWNGEVRVFCEHAWQLLWRGEPDEREVRITAAKDFLYKTGLDPSEIVVSTLSALPYPPQKILSLWLGVGAPERLIYVTAPGAPTTVDGARMMLPVAQMRESYGLPFRVSHVDMPALADPAAGVWGDLAPLKRELPGGDSSPYFLTRVACSVLGFSPVVDTRHWLLRVLFSRPPTFREWSINLGVEVFYAALTAQICACGRLALWKAFARAPALTLALMHHCPSMLRALVTSYEL